MIQRQPTTTRPGETYADLLVEMARLRMENAALRRKNKSLETYRELAHHDPLTGLGNRRSLDQRIGQEVARARRRIDGVFSVLVIDLDGFKQINDERGHAAGDECLRWVARFLEAEVRVQDVCCRAGGDEFVIVLPETDALGAERVRQRLLTSLQVRNRLRDFPVHFSVGLATWPADGGDARTLLEVADRDMYRRKPQRNSRSIVETCPDLEAVRPRVRDLAG